MTAIVRIVQYWNKISDSVTFSYKKFMKTTNTFLDHVDALAVECYSGDSSVYWVFQEELAVLREYIP